ncbi:MAG: hypothetical protein QOE70_1005 [Chthoniobacter sp.]|nr:hypothetical protein [Chthoniobacter sp.]
MKAAFYRAGYSIKKIRPRSRPATSGDSEKQAGSPDLLRLLHRTDPYEGFDFQSHPLDLQGWGGESPAFRELISEIKPRLVIEVGSWKGASAVQMGLAIEEANLPTTILCVDTWLGALEFWLDHHDPERYQSLQLRHGYPSVYSQFLANVCHRGLQKRIVPFPQTSSIAAVWLRKQGITAELIYVDGSHEEEDVYQDLCSYWELLAGGGILFGDDYAWDGVRLAVDRFAREIGLEIRFLADKWVLKKR